MDKDTRWVQRLSSYCRALDTLKQGIELGSKRDVSLFERSGVIKMFECAHELSWNALKDFLESTGESGLVGSRDVFQLAFRRGLVTRGADLMESVRDRNLTSHTYNEETADRIFRNILEKYYDAFEEVRASLLREKEKRGL